jgi:hypothetical protein
MRRIRRYLRWRVDMFIRQHGYTIIEIDELNRTTGDRIGNVDFLPEWIETMRRARRYTMVSDERMAGLISGIEYIVRAGIPGAFVECGVWRGGSSVAAALTCQRLADIRDIYLFDTFEGMTQPGPFDIDYRGAIELDHWDSATAKAAGHSAAEVKETMLSTGYDTSRLHFVKGRVEDTVPDFAPDKIAMLRLDTDWYESTRHELQYLYPRLASGGILIVDDYGHCMGARRAVDEYFARSPVMLARLDYSGRLVVKA